MKYSDIETEISFLKFCALGTGLFCFLSLFWKDLATTTFLITLVLLLGAFDLIFKMDKHIKELNETIDLLRETKK